MTANVTVLPEPLCRFRRHPLRWVWNTLQLAIAAGVFAYIGMLIVVALYYLILETTPTMKSWWHHTVPNSYWRHNIRNIGEGLLGGLLAQQVIWNHYKKKVQKRLGRKRNVFDRIEIALHIPNVKDGKPFSIGQLLVTPFLVVIYAIPGFLIGIKLVDFFHNHNLHALSGTVASAHPLSPQAASIATKMQQTFTQDWPKKLVGYFAAFCLGRRPAKGVFDDVQLLFAERRVQNGQGVRWYHTPTFKARYTEVLNSPTQYTVQHTVLMKRLVIGALPVALVLAGFGWYVLSYIA